MQNLELKIAPRDWAVIFAIGIIFASLLSALQYFLAAADFWQGALFGAILGCFIVTLSMLFITTLNTRILPEIKKSYWTALAALFSFLAGFFGTLLGDAVAGALDIGLLQRFESHLLFFAALLGVLTYMIGSLLYQFVKMSNQKEHHQKQLYKSRVKSLETQLNPHFLFNALNSLAELLHTDTKRSEEALMQLSQFLRSGMKEETLIPLSLELENVARYVALENIRFSDKIALRVSGQREFAHVRVPKFSIQLLVENAIKHGFDPLAKEFAIFITIHKEQKLHIRVQNSGKAVTTERFGIGLSNLKERVSILCGGTVHVKQNHPPIYEITLGVCNESTVS